MKKHILAFCLACLVAMSANVFAATPEAETLSVEQQGAQKWIETMLVKSDYKAALSQLGAEGKKALTEKQMKEKQEAIIAVLKQDPRPSYQNIPDRIYGVEFSGFDVRFTVQDMTLTVCEVVPDFHRESRKCIKIEE